MNDQLQVRRVQQSGKGQHPKSILTIGYVTKKLYGTYLVDDASS